MTDDLKAIVKRIDTGKAQPGDLASLRAAVAQVDGSTPMVFAHTMLIRHIAEEATDNRSAQVVAVAEVERLQESLGFSRSTGVERMLIEHVGVCWLRLQVAESELTRATSGQHALAEGRYREVRLTEAQVRYLRAVALLEKLRRYAPPLQINIANQQVVKNP